MFAALALMPAAPSLAAAELDIASANQFRKDLGFEHGLEFTRDTFSKEGAYPNEQWGIPLSKAEAADMAERSRVRPKLDDVFEFATSRDASAGVYMDQKAGGVPVFLFTKNLDAQRDAIREQMPNGVEFEVRQVDYSLAELNALQAVVAEDMDQLREQGIPVNQVATSTRENRVMVGLEKHDNDAAEVLVKRYGPMVATQYIGPTEWDACPRGNCRPLKGGLWIQRQTVNKCTSGFIGRRVSNQKLHVLTAGHCLNVNGGVGNCGPNWQHNEDVFGCARDSTLPPGGGTVNADIGWILIDDNESINNGGQAKNRVYGPDQDEAFSVSSITNSFAENDTLCVSRASSSSHWKCGLVDNTCATKSNGVGWTITCVVTMEFDSIGGDSGAPYVRQTSLPSGGFSYAAAGIHSHSSDSGCGSACRSWFTRAAKVASETPIRICDQSDCPVS